MHAALSRAGQPLDAPCIRFAEARAAGFDHHLLKPIELSQILPIVGAYLG